MKKIILLALMAMLFVPATMSAEDNNDKKEVQAYVSGTLLSKYIWRGSELAGICIQPEAGISWKGLSLVASGNAGFQKDDVEEFDITLGYERWGFNIGVTDYWSTGVDPENRYFYYDPHLSSHQFEANIGYTCNYFSLQAYTMFWGNDFKINGDRAYSTFIELSVPFRLAGLDWDARVGVTPMESAGFTTPIVVESIFGQVEGVQNHYFYGEGFTCNVAKLRATKTFNFKHLEIPVFAEVNTNPYLQKAHFLLGVTVKAF